MAEEKKTFYAIQWNVGYGTDCEIVEAKDKAEADRLAYEKWRDEAENNSDYSASENPAPPNADRAEYSSRGDGDDFTFYDAEGEELNEDGTRVYPD